MDPALAIRCVGELHLDNAKAHLSLASLATQSFIYGSTPVFGKRASPNRRPHIEGFFNILQNAALKKWVDLGAIPHDVLCHAVDALIAAHNASKAPGSSRSRLQCLRDMVSTGQCIHQKIPVAQREILQKYDLAEVHEIGIDHETLVLRWVGARYYGRALYKRSKGDAVLIRASSKDPREIQISCMRTGEILGSLQIENAWNHIHDLQVRRWAINDPEFKEITKSGVAITEAITIFLERSSQGARIQRKRARIALQHADSNSMKSSIVETPPAHISNGSKVDESLATSPNNIGMQFDKETNLSVVKKSVRNLSAKNRLSGPGHSMLGKLLGKIRSQ